MEFLKLLGWAVAWQVVPFTWCAVTFGSQSQLPGILTLLLLVMPLVATAHQYVFVQQDRRAWKPALAAFGMTALVGAASIATYAGAAIFLLWSAGPHW